MINKCLEQIIYFLLGIVIGDVFGVGVEFQDCSWIWIEVDFIIFVNVRV